MSSLQFADLSIWRAALAQNAPAALEQARALAESSQAQLNGFTTLAVAVKSQTNGALGGIPYAHKDVFCTQGLRTTAGSRILSNFIPPYDATVSTRLNQAGAICLGKASMDEFAMGSSNENNAFGVVRNPWDLQRVPGGSSGGSAALVAAGVVPFATGSDTGGSVRQPAAFCGVTGFKPTYGRISRYGMIAFASSLDQAGVIARAAHDCAQVLQVLAGFDAQDATSVDRPVDDFVAACEQGLRGLRVGVARDLFSAGIRDAVALRNREALAAMERAGAILVDIDLPMLAASVPAYYVIAPAEASSNLARYDGVRFGHRAAEARDLNDLYSRSRSEGFGEEVKRRILVGSFVLSAGYYDAYYLRAQQVRRLIAEDFARAFTKVDVIAGPTTPDVAFKIGEKSADPLAMYAADINTVAVNLAGLPAVSLPCGFVDGLPVGMQLIGPAWGETTLFAASHGYQKISDWHRQTPTWRGA